MPTPQTEVIVSKDGVELARRIVTPGAYLFGRGGDVDFPMETPLASRHHARLTVNPDEWLIEDLASANGTFINDQPVPPNKATRVFPTQSLRVGDATVTLRRLRESEDADDSVAPGVATLRAVLPEEIRKDRRYAIGKLVAQGGMGAILSALDQTIHRGVAMKVMLQSGGSEDVLRFVEEAQITGQLEHPNIVPVYELGVDEQDQPFYTMKFVRGISLRKILELIAGGAEATVKKYPLGALLTIFQKVCDGLAFAHAKGVIHRDLKPENIMIGEYGEALVMDWGLAKVLGKSQEAGGRSQKQVYSARQEDAGNATLAGSIMGTPQYMSPEQAGGEIDRLDARTDIYALGAILYHLLTLQAPVMGRDVNAVLAQVRAGTIVPPLQRVGAKRLPHLPDGRVPESLAAVAMKALALSRSARYASVKELQADIDAYQTGFATKAESASAWKQFTLFLRRHKTVSAAAAIIVVLTTGFLIKVIASERRAIANEKHATESLHKLRGTAPTFLAQAQALIEKQQFADALEKIDFAVALQPEDAEYLFVKGNLLQSLFRFEEARVTYTAALTRKPDHAFAKENAALCDAIIQSDAGRTPPSTTSLNTLRTAMQRQNRNAEAVALLRVLGKDTKAIYDTARAAMVRAGLPVTPDRFHQNENGLLSVIFNGYAIDDLAPLRGMPVGYLNIAGTKVNDLGPLAGMPLEMLWMSETQVRDLSPLKGMKLKTLHIDACPIADLSPLAGMPLDTLRMRNTRVTDLSPLRGMPLKALTLSGWTSAVRDVTPLAGLPLTDLDLQEAKVGDISALKGMPLKRLVLRSSYVTDLAPLKGMPLTELDIGSTKIRDLAPLRGMKLETFDATGTPVSDLAPLDGMPLTNLGLLSTAVRDLSPLKNSKIKILDIRNTAVADISPLRDQPIAKLNCWADRIPDLTPIQTMPLKRLWALGAKLNDLTFLKNVPLEELCLEGSTISDIRGLAGMPLRALILTRTAVRDLTPLATCRKLEQLAFSPECKDIEFLRSLPSLQRLDTTWTSGTDVVKPAAVFWKEYDAKKGAAPK